jgi:hypothetical protein
VPTQRHPAQSTHLADRGCGIVALIIVIVLLASGRRRERRRLLTRLAASGNESALNAWKARLLDGWAHVLVAHAARFGGRANG